MKNLLIVLSFLGFGYAQAQVKTIVLKDGSSLLGELIELDTASGMAVVRLNDLTEIKLATGYIADIGPVRQQFITFDHGKKFMTKGRYATLAMNVLLGRTDFDFTTTNRRNFGGHFSSGYQFNQFFALGGGAGLDFHTEILLPVFFEIKGHLTNALGFSLKNRQGTGYRFPITYNLQVGHNFIFGKKAADQGRDLSGGLMWFPNVGLTFPTRSNTSLQFSIGYKFQQYRQKITDWTLSTIEEKITLKSLALRAGVVF